MASKQVFKNANGVNAEITLINPDSNTTKKTVDVSSIQHKEDTIASLRALTELHETVWVSGYHTKDDGAFGSHFFRWNSTSTEDDNGGTVIKLDSVETGRYELQYSGSVNVKWFGASTLNIASDNLTYINNALGTQEEVIINESYNVLSGLVAYNNVSGIGELILEDNSSGLTQPVLNIEDEAIVSGIAFTMSNVGKAIGICTNSNNVDIHLCTFSGTRRGAVRLNKNAENIKVYSNNFTGGGYHILYDDADTETDFVGTDANNIRIYDNTIIGDKTLLVSGDGIEINSPNSGSSNIHIYDNTVIDMYTPSGGYSGIGIGVSGGTGIYVKDNIIEGCSRDGIHIEDGSSLFGPSTKVEVLNNEVLNCGIDSEISGIAIQHSEALVKDNTVIGSGSSGIAFTTYSSRNPNTPSDGSKTKIADNTVRLSQRHGIIAQGIQYSKINGNTCVDNSQLTTNTYDGINVTDDLSTPVSSADFNKIYDNIIDGDSHRYGINDSGDKNVIAENTIGVMGTDKILTSFTAIKRLNRGFDSQPDMFDFLTYFNVQPIFTDGLRLAGGQTIQISSLDVFQAGSGSPEGVVEAGLGAMYLNTSGGTGSTLYVKESGGTTNTGWVAK